MKVAERGRYSGTTCATIFTVSARPIDGSVSVRPGSAASKRLVDARPVTSKERTSAPHVLQTSLIFRLGHGRVPTGARLCRHDLDLVRSQWPSLEEALSELWVVHRTKPAFCGHHP
jgi:hypothetical protein